MKTMPELNKYKMYINGKWVDSENKKTFETLNPENNEAWAIVPEANEKDVDTAIKYLKRAGPRLPGRVEIKIE